jgi:hypothetical protein
MSKFWTFRTSLISSRNCQSLGRGGGGAILYGNTWRKKFRKFGNPLRLAVGASNVGSGETTRFCPIVEKSRRRDTWLHCAGVCRGLAEMSRRAARLCAVPARHISIFSAHHILWLWSVRNIILRKRYKAAQSVRLVRIRRVSSCLARCLFVTVHLDIININILTNQLNSHLSI